MLTYSHKGQALAYSSLIKKCPDFSWKAIILPPGEKTVAAMYVDKDAYEVTTTRAGRDLAAYDTITIRPSNDTGEVDSFILTESSRRYLLHFVTGTTGM